MTNCDVCGKAIKSGGMGGHKFFAHTDKGKKISLRDKNGSNNPAFGTHTTLGMKLNWKPGELEYRRDRMLGNKLCVGRILSEESRKTYSLAKIGNHNADGNKNVKGKKWKLSEESKDRHRVATRKMWDSGVFDNAKMGRGKSGHREDIGHFVRSRWEANYARYLNYIKEPYTYEKKTFQLEGYRYRPDFFLINRNTYVEVKGYETPLSIRKRQETIEKYGVKIEVVGHKEYKALSLYSAIIATWE